MLPWREWHSMNQDMGALEADKAYAFAVLQNLHAKPDAARIQVEVLAGEKGTTAVAAVHVKEKRSIMLPACIPRQSKVFEKSEHPFAVNSEVKVISNILGKVSDDDKKVIREQTLFVLPEFKAPSEKETKAPSEKETTAAVAGSIPLGTESKPHIEWIWGAGVAETMHPFWAVRRLTTEQLAR